MIDFTLEGFLNPITETVSDCPERQSVVHVFENLRTYINPSIYVDLIEHVKLEHYKEVLNAAL